MSVRNTNHVAVLITADEVSIITAPVARADHSWAVIVISDMQLHENGVHPGVDPHLLDQGKHLGMTSGLGLLYMASLCIDGQHGHKAECKAEQRIIIRQTGGEITLTSCWRVVAFFDI